MKSWPALRRLIPADWLQGESKSRKQTLDLARNRYLQNLVLAGVEQALALRHPGQQPADFAARRTLAATQLGAALNEPQSWGDGSSAKMIDALKQAGLPRLWLGLPQWTAGFAAPQGIRSACQRGGLSHRSLRLLRYRAA